MQKGVGTVGIELGASGGGSGSDSNRNPSGVSRTSTQPVPRGFRKSPVLTQFGVLMSSKRAGHPSFSGPVVGFSR